MTTVLTVVAAILVFGVVILVHEGGHFLAARRCGIRVDEFSIGFGPALWSRVKNGTRYSLRLFPLGGYNALAGETAGEGDDPAESPRPYDPDAPLLPMTVRGKLFSEAGPWQRLFVIAAGALMNFLLGFVLLVALMAVKDALATAVIYDFDSEDAVTYQTGLRAGDEILAVNGHPCFVFEDVVYEMQTTASATVSMTVLRDGRVTNLPAVTFDAAMGEDGIMNIALDFRVCGVPKTPQNVVRYAARYFLYYARAILRSLGDLAAGKVEMNQLSGPVGVVSAVSEAVRYGLKDVLSLAALITINLGIFNLLPIPGLDGFKLLFLLFEGATGKAVPERIQAGLNAAGLIALMVLMVMITYQDILRFIPQ